MNTILKIAVASFILIFLAIEVMAAGNFAGVRIDSIS